MLVVFLFLVLWSFCEGLPNTTTDVAGTPLTTPISNNSTWNIILNAPPAANPSIVNVTTNVTSNANDSSNDNTKTSPATSTPPLTTSSKTTTTTTTTTISTSAKISDGTVRTLGSSVSGWQTTSGGLSSTSAKIFGSGKDAPESRYDTLVALMAVTLTIVIILVVFVVIAVLFLKRRWDTVPRRNDPPDVYHLAMLHQHHHSTDAEHGEVPEASQGTSDGDIHHSGQETYDAVGEPSPPSAYSALTFQPPSTGQTIDSAHKGDKKKIKKKKRRSDQVQLQPSSPSSASLDTQVDKDVYENC